MEISKREERIMIIELLYGYDLNNDYIYLNPMDDYSDYVEKIDEIISDSLTNYKINRLSYVDRAIIRMATSEMLLGLSPNIAINEALEIVKIYTDEGNGAAVRFVNKLLDNISKKI